MWWPYIPLDRGSALPPDWRALRRADGSFGHRTARVDRGAMLRAELRTQMRVGQSNSVSSLGLRVVGSTLAWTELPGMLARMLGV
jgi:hypothetical protein